MRLVLAVLPASLALLSASPVVAAGYDAHRLWTLPGDPGSRFGSAVAAGDVNGDGFRDLIVGASNAITSAGEPDGKAFAYYGGPGGLPNNASARCRYAPQRTGDVDSIITIAPGGTILHELGGGITSLPVVNTAYLLLGPGVADPDLSNNQATAVLGPPLQILLRDDFESGHLSAWSFHTGRGLEVAPEASLQGRYGLAVSPRVAGSAVVRDDSPAGPAASDGQLLLRLDGADAVRLGSLDNDAGGGIDSVELRLADAGRPFFAGRRGGVRLDAFLSWRPN